MSGDDDKLGFVPERTPGEVAEEAIKTVATALTGPGAPLAVQLWEAVSPGYKKRLHDWFDGVAQEINDLKSKYQEFQHDRLARNELFQTALWTAAQAAIRNHQQEKREYLRNTVLNSAMPGDLEESRQLVFLQLVDRLTALHVKVLTHFNDPAPYVSTRKVDGMSLEQVCLDRFAAELDGVLLRIIISELERDGLLMDRVTLNKFPQREHGLRRTTDLGRDFVKYVTTKPA